jgi:predicted dehydrogenase
VTVGVIGYGYWGPNLVRNFIEVPEAQVVAIADLNEERLAQARLRHPELTVTRHADQLIGAEGIDALVIATPPASHFDLAMKALKAGKHVLVEKPVAVDARTAMALIMEAERRRRVLMVDHTFVYTGAVRKIQDLLASGSLGEMYYYDSVRINLGLFQSDLSVLWDLAIHDLSILDALTPVRPISLSAYGVSHVTGQPENIAYLTLVFPQKQIAHFHVNWLAPVKVRRILIGCRDKMVVYDDVEPSEKIKIYDRGALVSEDPESKYPLLVSYRQGDVWAPRLDGTEALKVEAMHFVECIRTGLRPKTDGRSALRIVKILQAAEQSMREGGRMVSLSWEDEP